MLHSDCVKKILALGEGEAVNIGFLSLFEAVVNDSDIQELPSGTLVLPFYDEDTNFQPGEWAAELHFVARKMGEIDETKDSDPGGDSASEEV